MQHIKQRTSIDCGLATAAMLAGLSYAAAAREGKRLLHEGGLSCPAFVDLMTALTGRPWRISRPAKRPLERSSLPACPSAIVIRPDYRDYGHWIAFDGQRIFDPSLSRIYRPSAFPKRHWSTIRLVLPSAAPKLPPP